MVCKEYNSIELNVWYAIDKYDRIIELLTSGFGNIPEFVYIHEGNNKMLEDYFEAQCINDYLNATGKDYFCFDACKGDNNNTNYIKLTSPQKPLLFSDLPENIKSIISYNTLDIDAESTDSIIVEPSYSTRINLDYMVPLILNGEYHLSKKKLFSVNLKTKLKYTKLIKSLKKDSGISFMKVRSKTQLEDKKEISKNYYSISTSQGEYILYLVYRRDTDIYDKSGLYSIQISKKDKALFDFNDKAGVWIEC